MCLHSLPKSRRALISELAQTIIPKTDTPGAKEAGVPGFIDQILKECYKKEDQDKFITGLTEFDSKMRKPRHGDSFIYFDAEKQLAFVKAQNEAAVTAVKADPSHTSGHLFLPLKNLPCWASLPAEPGATQVLQYEAVPGSYKGCIPLSEAGNGKTWAS
jgi:gluconate 2-dehydrogenase gamma chain